MAKWLLNTQRACWNCGIATLIQLFLSSSQWNKASWRGLGNKKTWIKYSGSVGISLNVLCSSFSLYSSSFAFSCLVLLEVCVYLHECVLASYVPVETELKKKKLIILSLSVFLSEVPIVSDSCLAVGTGFLPAGCQKTVKINRYILGIVEIKIPTILNYPGVI